MVLMWLLISSGGYHLMCCFEFTMSVLRRWVVLARFTLTIPHEDDLYDDDVNDEKYVNIMDEANQADFVRSCQ